MKKNLSQYSEIPEDIRKLLKDKGLTPNESVLAHSLIVLYPVTMLADVVEKGQSIEVSHSFISKRFNLEHKPLYAMADRLTNRGIISKRTLPCCTGSYNVCYRVFPDKLLNLFTPDN